MIFRNGSVKQLACRCVRDAAQRLRHGTQPAAVALLAGLLMTAAGCSRAFWRNQGESDAYAILSEKVSDSRWDVPRYGIIPDPRSRFYDPYDPDREPLPPDDPAAHEYMHLVNGMSGYKSWHEFGDALSVENPQWLTEFGMTQIDGEVQMANGMPVLNDLGLVESLELSYIHSREYQFEIENVYLAALALTLQRFEFDVRYLGIGGGEPSANVTGRSVPDGQNSVTSGVRAGISQMLPAGGQWAVELANNTLWLFSHGNITESASTLSYRLTQPLFLGAGRKVVLNDLTQAERDVLYAVRDLARFRKEFFTGTVASGSGFLGLLQQRQLIMNREFNLRLLRERVKRSRALSSQQPNRFSVAVRDLPAELMIPLELRRNFNFEEADTGYLLYWQGPEHLSEADAEQIRSLSDDEQYLEAANELIDRMRSEIYEPLDGLPEGFEFPEGIADHIRFDADEGRLYWRGPLFEADLAVMEGLIARNPSLAPALQRLVERLSRDVRDLSLAQLETQLTRQINNIRDSQRRYQDLLDQFKFRLGLPTDMDVTIDEALLEQFELIDPRLLDVEDEIKRYAETEILEFSAGDRSLEAFRELVAKLEQLRQLVERNGIRLLEQDFAQVDAIIAANDAGTAGPGMRKFYEEDERARVLGDVERDREFFADSILGLYREIADELDSLRDLVARPDIQAVMSEFDTNKDGEITLGELPAQWADVFEVGRQETITSEDVTLALTKKVSELVENLLLLTGGLIKQQIGLRTETVPLNEFVLPDGRRWPSMEECVEIALESRLDLMNARASVMDARRRVEVAANRLEAVLDVVVDGDVRSTRSENPLDFRGDLSEFRIGLQFTAPVTLVAERNAYNAALVAYQRERRAYMAFEDRVKQEVRQSWRQLMVLRANVNNDRESIRLAALQYDSAVEEATRGATNALNLLNALNGILSAQDALINDWVGFESSRLNIFLDMGIMEVDPRGVWFDDFYQNLTEEPAPLSPELTAIDDASVGVAEILPAESDSPVDSGQAAAVNLNISGSRASSEMSVVPSVPVSPVAPPQLRIPDEAIKDPVYGSEEAHPPRSLRDPPAGLNPGRPDRRIPLP